MIRVGQPIMFNYFISKTRLIAVTPRTGSGLDAAGRCCRQGGMLLAWGRCGPSLGGCCLALQGQGMCQGAQRLCMLCTAPTAMEMRLKVKRAHALLSLPTKPRQKTKPMQGCVTGAGRTHWDIAQEEAGPLTSPGLSFFPAPSIPEGSYKAILVYCHP